MSERAVRGRLRALEREAYVLLVEAEAAISDRAPAPERAYRLRLAADAFEVASDAALEAGYYAKAERYRRRAQHTREWQSFYEGAFGRFPSRDRGRDPRARLRRQYEIAVAARKGRRKR